ncbi:hypothetical protein O4H53_25940 [Sulfitobacter sp. G21635-S1]|uniref:hypothetical protein n=1 Tax=Sulfitobacter sp. G21635-S1 TaxID=3014043 RepID=UPI0022B073E2|nr:hypothetical protein [Sulfitobacter sp. G21635-S1]MCZ4258996.1 hypothetical protein [Sulfitobacter sp. G21635-S1]
MASPAEIENDLRARAALLDRTQMKDHAKAMRRAADALRQQREVIAQMDAAAEAADQKYEDYVYGKGV